MFHLVLQQLRLRLGGVSTFEALRIVAALFALGVAGVCLLEGAAQNVALIPLLAVGVPITLILFADKIGVLIAIVGGLVRGVRWLASARARRAAAAARAAAAPPIAVAAHGSGDPLTVRTFFRGICLVAGALAVWAGTQRIEQVRADLDAPVYRGTVDEGLGLEPGMVDTTVTYRTPEGERQVDARLVRPAKGDPVRVRATDDGDVVEPELEVEQRNSWGGTVAGAVLLVIALGELVGAFVRVTRRTRLT